MRLPVIKHIVSFLENNDEDYVVETMETLEDLIDLDSLKDEELDVIGELLSNLSNSILYWRNDLHHDCFASTKISFLSLNTAIALVRLLSFSFRIFCKWIMKSTCIFIVAHKSKVMNNIFCCMLQFHPIVKFITINKIRNVYS